MIFITEENVKLALHAGFCYGVKRAVETVKKLKKENPDKNVYVLGEIIHNSQVIKELEDLGIKTVDELPEENGGICVIRSHGASLDVLEEIEKKGYEIVDLTCPDVKKVQNKAISLVKEGYFLIILGRSGHPEVNAIEANAKKFASTQDRVIVAMNRDDLQNYEEVLKKEGKVAVVVQTTQRIEYLKEITNYLLPLVKELKIANTICASTKLRQNEAGEMAKTSDVMVVVGSKKSANTTHLAEILSRITKTIHIEDNSEITMYSDIIKNANSIGITAGASTPDYIINKVLEEIKMSKGE